MNIGFWVMIALVIVYVVGLVIRNKSFQHVPVDQLGSWVGANNERVVIDVREKDEYQSGHFPGSINVPLSGISGQFSKIPKDKDVAVICRSGNRSMQAVRILKQNGYTRIWNVARGISAWSGQTEKGNKPGKLQS